MAELHDLTALEQGEAVRRREVSPRELVDHYLARIERLSDSVGAFVTVTAELARKQALLAESRAGEGGPLFGVPTAVKDLTNTAGVRTTFGSATMRDFVPDVSDEVVLRMEAAGTISLGKTTTPEFGSPCYTEPDVAPPARTPYDLSRMAGGSSGGAGAAVAAGLVPVAQGSDGGGSIRIPASCCGLVGFKPSRGRVSGAPMYGDPIGLGTAGPLARTVRDAAAFLDAIADPVIADVQVHPEVLRAYEGASRLLEWLGHDIEDVEVPLPPDATRVFETCWSVLTALTVVPPEREHELRPLTRWLSERGRKVSGPEFGLALGELRRIAAGALRRLAPYDVVLTPTLARPPLPIGAIRDDADPARDFQNQKEFTPWTSAWNVTGMPAVSLPLHMTPDGLPVGVMLAARPGQDHVLFALAAQVEAAVPWVDRHPSCW